MTSNRPDLEALILREVELRKQAEERQQQAEERIQQAKERTQQAEKQIQQTTFSELIQYCHKYFYRPLNAEIPIRSTTGQIQPPTRKHCPFRFEHWSECESKQQEIYSSVCSYLEPSGQTAARLFSPHIALKDLGKRFERAIRSEQDLRDYERFGPENYVSDIITELSKIPAARAEFRLSDGVRFESHARSLVADEADLPKPKPKQPKKPPPKLDQDCIHRIDGDKRTLLTTVEYKPPHKLSVQNLRAGLRPMHFWKKNPRLTGSALVQEYSVMIEAGLEYSYVTNGLALVLLRVDYDEPGTLYYHLCEPNREIGQVDNFNYLLQPLTAVSRILCLCLMCFRSQYRDQEWRNKATQDLPIWESSFDETFSQIPKSELQQKPPDSDDTSSEVASSEIASRDYVDPLYLPSSSPTPPPTSTRQTRKQSQARCAPPSPTPSDGSPDPDADPAAGGRKRGSSQITSSPSSAQISARKSAALHTQSGGQDQQHTAQFCTQQCLLGLQQGHQLDYNCPNVKLHRQGGNSNRHLINADMLIEQLKQQLDKNIDQDCTPMGDCGATGAPFKVTCTAFGYTVVGKGTTSDLWDVVSREAEVYRFLRQAQGSAVPVSLGKVNLAKFFYVHGAGKIRHMLIMAWGGEPIHEMEHDPTVAREIERSVHEINSLGVLYGDLRSENILWNTELGRAMVIDFHRSELIRKATKKRKRLNAKSSRGRDLQARTNSYST
ncbi:hypothetical protein BDW67DRAFT_190958 [Aspergillus spinulosporus]